MKNHARVLFFVSVASLCSCAPLKSSKSETHQLNADVSPAEALALLKAGNKRFVNEHLAPKDKPSQRRGALANGQKPFAVIVGCADSRTAPEIVFDQQLGSLFVCRVAGNVTDPVVLGSVEYAVEHLHAPLVVILGHSSCGAISAALAGRHADGNIGSLLQHVHTGTGLPEDKQSRTDAAVANNTAYQKKSLTTDSPLISKLVKEGKVKIASGVYSLQSGEVVWQ